MLGEEVQTMTACKRIEREYAQLKLFPPEEKREPVQLTLEGG
jgi:hypothetical protein